MITCPHCKTDVPIRHTSCTYCGGYFVAVAQRGRPPLYCSPECKQSAADDRQLSRRMADRADRAN